MALNLLFLVLNRPEKEWTMPAWCVAKAQLAILCGERFTLDVPPDQAARR